MTHPTKTSRPHDSHAAPHGEGTTHSTAARALTALAWCALVTCIVAWFLYVLVPAAAGAAFITGIASGAFFLLCFILQLVG